MKKRVLAALLALLLAAFLPAAWAEETADPRELPYAYLSLDASYLVVGRPVTLTVALPGDPARFSYQFSLFYHEDPYINTEMPGIDRTGREPAHNYTFTPEAAGKYFLTVEVEGADDSSITLKSQPLFAYPAEDEANPATLPGKVKALAAETLAQGFTADYDKALYLYDYLIHHADYDTSLTIHHPDGVLLKGSGVCESYALAYQMLLHEVGIPSLYVTGYSRGESHAWNLARLDGEWTQIDPTWGDPVAGEEGHDYFGLRDELMARDHDWAHSNFIYPAAATDRFNFNLINGFSPFGDEAGLTALLEAGLAAKSPLITYSYQGGDRFFDLNYAVDAWLKANAYRFGLESYRFGGSRYSGQLEGQFRDESGYLFFTSGEELARHLESQLGDKAALVKLAYRGDDRYFDFRSALEDWLGAHYQEYGVTRYQYSCSQYAGEITLGY